MGDKFVLTQNSVKSQIGFVGVIVGVIDGVGGSVGVGVGVTSQSSQLSKRGEPR